MNIDTNGINKISACCSLNRGHLHHPYHS
jgi:hypothetical protein